MAYLWSPMFPISPPLPTTAVDARWKSVRWRIGPTLVTIALGLIGFSGGVATTDRLHVTDDGFLAHLYYTLGLFIFGGMDLGTPTGGTWLGRACLWTAYFAAPSITASAVIEASIRVFGGDQLFRRRLSDHVVIVGGERLTRIYLRRLRDRAPRTQVLVLGAPGDASKLEELRTRYHVHTLEGRSTSRVVLRRLRLDRARLILVLADDDFRNFDTATRMLKMHASIEDRLHVHVHDLVFLRSMVGLHLPVLRRVFNGHERAAQRLVRRQLLHHFQRTEAKNKVVLAGFGHFGQTVLNELQTEADGLFDRVVLVDIEARRKARTFKEQVGFTDGYSLDVIDGDIRFPDVWATVAQHIDLDDGEPVILIGSGDDAANIRVAMSLAERYRKAMVIARNEQQWSFAASLQEVAKIRIVNVVQLVGASMPDDWFRFAAGRTGHPGAAGQMGSSEERILSSGGDGTEPAA